MSFDGKGRKTIREIQAITEEKLAIFQTRGTSSKNKGTFEDFIPMFSRYERSLPLQPIESRFSLPLPRGRVKTGRVKERSRARTRVTRTQQVFVFHVHPSPAEWNRLIERPIGVKALPFVVDEATGEGEFQKSSPLLGWLTVVCNRWVKE